MPAAGITYRMSPTLRNASANAVTEPTVDRSIGASVPAVRSTLGPNAETLRKQQRSRSGSERTRLNLVAAVKALQ